MCRVRQRRLLLQDLSGKRPGDSYCCAESQGSEQSTLDYMGAIEVSVSACHPEGGGRRRLVFVPLHSLLASV